MEFKDSKETFDAAIKSGRLTTQSTDENYAGNYMYMGTQKGVDLFKNIMTRRYLSEVR